jgi:DNA repair protein RadA/Sms
MVDTVLYFEHSDSELRILRAVKNRFGSLDELGFFTMETKGLVQLKDPASCFLVNRPLPWPSGVAAAPVYEGSRVLMVEIQALVIPAKGSVSRVFSDRIDSGRAARVAAIIEKHLGLVFSNLDIYVNIAGGIKINETGIELPLAAALYSAGTGLKIDRRIAMAGELSLAGELRPVKNIQARIKTAKEAGFNSFLGPKEKNREENTEADYFKAENLALAIKEIFGSRL